MDQDSTKGPDKRNWRERLGIGKQELPRIADEFKDEARTVDKAVAETVEALGGAARPVPGAAKPAPRVVKPAPMAPHVAKPAPRAPAPPVEAEAPPPARPAEPRRPAAPDPLADKLRAQRAAAERLAEQRVQAARARAEAVRRQTPAQPSAPQPSIIAEGKAARPKYSFADEEPQRPVPPQRPAFPAAPYPPQQAPQLAPPRPPLGGGYPPQPQPYGAGLNPNLQRPGQPYPPGYRPPQQPVPQGFRPIDPATGYPMQPGFHPPGVNRGYPGPAPVAPPMAGRMPVPPRGPEQAYVPPYAPAAPRPAAVPMARRPQRALPPAPLSGGEAEPGEDIFEAAPRPQPRASATEYTQAYQDMEDGLLDEPPRSAGPWILLLLLMLAAAVAGAGVWFYQTNIKTAGSGATGNVPVVEAPQQPGKVATEPVTDPAAGAAPAAPSRKAIYDRIVGDQEVLGGQMAPTEEAPVQPEGQSQPIPDPTGDSQPLPLPPPPGDGGSIAPQGSLTGASTTDTAMNVAPTSDKADGATPAASEPAAAQGQAAPQGEQLATGNEETITDPAPAAKPVVKKVQTAKAEPAKPRSADPYGNLGARPVVLVPPAQTAKSKTRTAAAPPPADTVTTSPDANAGTQGLYGDPVNPSQAVTAPGDTTATTTRKKGGGLMDLFRSNRTTTAAPATPEPEVAAVAPPPAAVTNRTAPKVTATSPPAATVGTGGYVVQLASFRSQAEATTESSRFKSRHGALLGGLSPIISEANVAGSTRYRLAYGPLASRSDATRLCSQLFAAGQPDCLVRSR